MELELGLVLLEAVAEVPRRDWIAANARNLARLQLEKYRDAVNVHFAKPETPTNNHGGASPTRFPELKNQASIRNFA